MGSIQDVLAGRSKWHVERGDCLDVLRRIPDEVADAIITDPPYNSGGLSAGDRAKSPAKKYVQSGTKLQRPDFIGDTRDQRGFAFWCILWLSECFRIAKEGAPVCLFSDWRQLPITTDILQGAGFVWRGVMPWDKTEKCRPQRGRFRNQAEYIVWGSKGAMPVQRGVPVLPGVIREPVRKDAKHHITGKPVETMRRTVRICEPGGLVLDPFSGSGSTGVACEREGLRFLGVEISDVYATIARERLAALPRAA